MTKAAAEQEEEKKREKESNHSPEELHRHSQALTGTGTGTGTGQWRMSGAGADTDRDRDRDRDRLEGAKRGRAGRVVKKEAKKGVGHAILEEDMLILKDDTTTLPMEGEESMVEHEEEDSDLSSTAPAAKKQKAKASSQQNHWSVEAENQLSEQIALHRQQGYSGPMLWELVSSKCDFNFSAEQCMSKFYREKTKERYKIQGKKRKDSSEPSSTVKWSSDGEDARRLNASVDRFKAQDHEGSKLWNLVADSLDMKWTASQCMNKYYRDRHKLQKLNK